MNIFYAKHRLVSLWQDVVLFSGFEIILQLVSNLLADSLPIVGFRSYILYSSQLPVSFQTISPRRSLFRRGVVNTAYYLFFGSWAGRIQQIPQSDWFLEQAEFSHTDHYSRRNPSGWSIFLNELVVIVNLSPFYTSIDD